MKNWLIVIGLIILASFGALRPGTQNSLICATEDSVNCIWIAPLQGNHVGNTIIVVNGPEQH